MTIFYLPFNVYESFIAGRRIYPVNDDIPFRLKNGLIVEIYTNLMQEE